MKIGLCDDEPAELQVLETCINCFFSHSDVEPEIFLFSRGQDLLDACTAGSTFDVLFLDIFMGDMDGIAVARTVRMQDKRVSIIFVTHSPEYAVEGFKVRALHYLVKPVTRQDIESVLTLVMETFRTEPEEFIQVKNKQGVYRVCLSEIMYAESELRQIILHTDSARSIRYYDRLDTLAGQLKDSRFLRCHKSYLVNLDFVHAVESCIILLYSGVRIPVSMRIAEVKSIFADYKSESVFLRNRKSPAVF